MTELEGNRVMNAWVPAWRWGSIVVSMAALVGCGAEDMAVPAGEPDHAGAAAVESAERGLYAQSWSIWSNPWNRLTVCWDTPGRSTEKAWVRSIIEREYNGNFVMDLVGWGDCALTSTGSADIRITVMDATARVTASGSALKDRKGGMYLNFDYRNWNTVCAGVLRRACIETDALHEFGHALGFSHEHNRADRPSWCTDAPQGTEGDVELGSWDASSIMNYCNPGIDESTQQFLSAGDKAGMALYYGVDWKGGGDVVVAHTSVCHPGEECRLADVNRDGKDDLVVFTRGSAADVWVALSDGVGFEDRRKVNDYFCLTGERCDVGDFNGDGYADLITFTYRGPVYVALNDRDGRFPTSAIWHDWFCLTGEACRVGDADFDGKDDIFTFVGKNDGRVFLATSTGSRFAASRVIHGWFCIGNEQCEVGDVNHDGRADLLAFTKGTSGGVWASWSTDPRCQGNYCRTEKIHSSFCYGNEVCAVGNLDGSLGDELIAFTKAGPVWSVSRVNGFMLTPKVWHGDFCVNDQVCRLGDVNGDRRVDLVAAGAGAVWVSPSGK